MAKFETTRVNALENVLNALNSNGITFENDTIEVVEHMVAQLNQRSASRPKGKSKAAMQNDALVKELLKDHNGELVTAKDVYNMGVMGITTISKATAVLVRAVNTDKATLVTMDAETNKPYKVGHYLLGETKQTNA